MTQQVVRPDLFSESAAIRQHMGTPAHFVLRSGILVGRILVPGSFVHLVYGQSKKEKEAGAVQEHIILFKHAILQTTLGPADSSMPITDAHPLPDDVEQKSLTSYLDDRMKLLRFYSLDGRTTTGQFVSLTPYAYIINKLGKKGDHLTLIINKSSIDYISFLHR